MRSSRSSGVGRRLLQSQVLHGRVDLGDCDPNPLCVKTGFGARKGGTVSLGRSVLHRERLSMFGRGSVAGGVLIPGVDEEPLT